MRSAESYVLLAESDERAHPAGRRGVLRLGRRAGRVGANAAGRADYQSRNGRDARSDDRANKGINYRMSPENAECLAAAGIDCCVLANNHVLDWGRSGLKERWQTCRNSTSKRRARAAMNVKLARRLCSSCRRPAPDLCVRLDIERRPAGVGCN
jgi:poly-gamma-glutamate synthesis protein (capsule biosynthesis protein)